MLPNSSSSLHSHSRSAGNSPGFDAPWEQTYTTPAPFMTEQTTQAKATVEFEAPNPARLGPRNTANTVLCDRCHNCGYLAPRRHVAHDDDEEHLQNGGRLQDVLVSPTTLDQRHQQLQHQKSQRIYDQQRRQDSHYHHAYIPPGPRSAPTPPTYAREETVSMGYSSQNASPRFAWGLASPAASHTRPMAALPGTMSSRTLSTTTSNLTNIPYEQTSTSEIAPDTYVSEIYINTPPPVQSTGEPEQEDTAYRSASISSSQYQSQSQNQNLSHDQPVWQPQPMTQDPPKPLFNQHKKTPSRTKFGKRCKSALKDVFKRNESVIDDTGLQRIEHKHWTEQGEESDDELW